MGAFEALVIGLAAGAIGTVVLTMIEHAEMAVTRRPASMVPGEVAVALTGGNPKVDRNRVGRMNLPMHFMHGTLVGVVFGALALLELGAVGTTVLFYVLLLGTDWFLYTALRVTIPWRWSGSDMARELVLKAGFAAALSIAFHALKGAVL